MSEERWRRELAEVGVPDADAAAERAWRLVQVAAATREPSPRVRRLPLALAAAVAAAAFGATVAATPPGRAAVDWVRDRVGRPTVREIPAPPAPPALGRLPAPGRLLVTAASGVWVVRPDGGRRRLGRYDGAAWSPRGLFVAAWRGRTLAALEPATGAVRWQLTAPAPVGGAAWAGPDGVWIAYLAGPALRLVEGDGDHDRLLAARAAPVRPAWRPGRHEVAYLDAYGTLRLYDPDATAERWRVSVPRDAHTVAWSADADTLLVASPRELVLLDAAGAIRRRVAVDGGELTSAAIGGDGRAVAYATLAGDGASEIRMLGTPSRGLLAGAGRIVDLTYAPDGSWLVASWPDTDQWLFLGTTGQRRVRAASDVTATFGGGPAGAAPAIDGWCCRTGPDG